ncbi:peptidoglycan-binding domain-containing protein [Rhodobacter calidifons]|uniref:Peptidoglycan-binding protein n=1 Tax=Rhodobacter calidifons TaxID=2715277 RepID=A0ABX0G8Z7_9RHOB|nr:peptidoglycan-binding domain-containing protein [Rhodobacter calidifons]NHB77711.1 peptidoglycan-binding protein [Rhodobacter calidifons]
MKAKTIATAGLMAAVALSPVSPVSTPARADGKDFIAGAIIGGLIGGAVANENNKKKVVTTTRTKTTSTKSTMTSAQREENREVQTALNYFGYNVGTPDGAIGPKSRAAISSYQALLGYPPTGQLTEHERTILVTSYHRAVAGGPMVASTVAGSPLGLKAVLIAQRDEMAGIAPMGGMAASGVPVPGSVGAAAAAALPALVPEAEPEVEEVAAAEPGLPSFMGAAGARGSLASECNRIGLTTTANGGMVTAETMQDASFALGEQFCLARSFAISKSDELTAQIAGFTPEQIATQCAAFGPALKDHVAALSLKPAASVLQGVEGFILSSGMSPAQLSGTAKVCLGVGYARDDLSVAIGSALLLAAMGERGYAEFLGHHLSQGFGATERPDLAMDWYQMSLDAMEQGQMVVAPGMAGRDAVIRKASYTINGRAHELAPEPVFQEAALPVFEMVPDAAPSDVAMAAPLAPVGETAAADAAPVLPAAPDGSMMNAGAQAAIMAARLPVLLFSGN